MDYGALVSDAEELRALSEILSWSFGFPIADAEPWLTRAGLENVRVLREGKMPVACLLLVPMGQFFGGLRVPMVGIAGVATAPEKRGSGAATALMRGAIKELHGSGAPISVLYPATRPLYRRAGYEPAGSRFELTIPLRQITTKERGLSVRPAVDGDRAAIESAYRATAVSRTGHLDRGGYIWNRLINPRGETARGFVIEQGGRVDGYAYLFEKRVSKVEYDLYVTDFVARSAAATRRLLTFFADHATTGRDVCWRTGPADALLQALPEVGFELQTKDHWMLRVVDVHRALAARGYLDGMEMELHLDVCDDLIPENGGRFVLNVAGGRGVVRKGGRGRLKLDIRGLAPLFTGHLPPTSLVLAGLVEGPDAELQRAATIFASPAPWMPDYF